MELTGAVKLFDTARGFGFVLPDADGPEVFVHASVLIRSGVTDLEPGQRIIVSAERVPGGTSASTISSITASTILAASACDRPIRICTARGHVPSPCLWGRGA